MGRAAAALARFEKGIFQPETLSEDGVVAIALIPPVAMGLLFFRGYAAAALGVALAVGAALQLLAWRLRLRAGVAPLVAAVFAVALLGPATPVNWFVIGAALAGGLEVARRRWTPRLQFQPGVLVPAAILFAAPDLRAAYLNPGRLRPLAEPVRLWWQYAGGSAAPIDPERLYIGNVPGPLFATSVLAVAVGAAWLWYARRLSPAVVLGFAVGAALPILMLHWSPSYQLDSGPAWFAVALILADRRLLPGWAASRLLLGFAAGVAGVGLRSRGFGIEAAYLAVAGLQVTVSAVEGIDWFFARRRRLAREEGVRTHPAPASGAARQGA